MLSNLDTNLKTRDRNLNFNLSDANSSMQVLDNQGKENVAVAKFSSTSSQQQQQQQQQPRSEGRARREYDNYHNTFTNGSNRNSDCSRGLYQPSLSSKIAQDDSSPPTALNKPIKKTGSMDSPGGRKLIRTPTQVRGILYRLILFSQKKLNFVRDKLIYCLHSVLVQYCCNKDYQRL